MLPLSPTADEQVHWDYGLQILTGNSDRLPDDDSKMPVSALNALPRYLGRFVPPGMEPLAQTLASLHAARMVTIIVSLLIGLYIFIWSRKLYGSAAAIVSLALFSLSPNIIAHAQLVTTDLYAAGGILIAGYYFWKFLNAPNNTSATVSAVALGISQLTKYSGIFLYLIFILIAGIRASGYLMQQHGYGKKIHVGRLLKYTGIFVFFNLLIINAGYGFNGTFSHLSSYRFMSDIFTGVTAIPHMPDLPVPLPRPYVQGLDTTLHYEKYGLNIGSIYFLGSLIHREDPSVFKGYYFIVSLFKTPLASQIIIYTALIYYLLFSNKKNFLRNEIFIIIPVIFFFLYFNLMFRTQIGIRHYLIFFPFLYILSGQFISAAFPLKHMRILICALLLWLTVSTLSYFPHYLAYTNELVHKKTLAYKLFADSNLDWQQNDRRLEEYLHKHPEAQVSPPYPTAGTVIVTINDLVGITESPAVYRWLRDYFEPKDHIGHSYLIYELSNTDLQNIPRGDTR